MESREWTGKLEDAEEMARFTGVLDFTICGEDRSFALGEQQVTVGDVVVKAEDGTCQVVRAEL